MMPTRWPANLSKLVGRKVRRGDMVPDWVEDLLREAHKAAGGWGNAPSEVLRGCPLVGCWQQDAPSAEMEVWLTMWRLGK